MAGLSDMLPHALQQHQAGKLPEAENLYRQILDRDPSCAEAWHLLGVARLQQRDYQTATQLIEQAIRLKPGQATFYNNLGEAYRCQGKSGEAVTCYRRALELEPTSADALNNLGLVLLSLGNVEEAIASGRRAVELRPIYPEAHNNLGNALKTAGKAAEAMACYRQALSQQPAFASALSNLGLALQEQGQLPEAMSCYEQALRLQPALIETHNNLGLACKALGQFDEAIRAFRRALAIDPAFVKALLNLGNCFQNQGQAADAVACYRQAVHLQANLASAHLLLGNALQAEGQVAEAVACYREAARLEPHNPAAHHNLGFALQLQGKTALARACYEQALRLRPDAVESLVNLAGLVRLEGRLSEAAGLCQKALEQQPDCAAAYGTLAAILQAQGRLDKAGAAIQRATALAPASASLYSTYLGLLHYSSDITPERLLQAHREYDSRFGASLGSARPAPWKVKNPERPLKLGLVSPHFARHPVGSFLIRALENLDRRQVAVVCYSDAGSGDDLTRRFKAAASAWREILGMADEAISRQIRADDIDILFDLAGHTGGNRLLVFARKPAPLQITWLDYEGTTGVKAIDYLLADRYEVPPEAERWYTEKILRMPHGFVCYEPPDKAPPVSPLPALKNGRLTFGSFNLLGKITPQVVAVWSRILQRLPGSRLLLKYHGLDDPGTAARFRQLFADQGLAPERLLLEGWSPYGEFLTRYHQIDIALDPFPYTGGLTTCEALWMGVPVVTCPGETFASRHGLSHLNNIGLTETIARDLDHYVDLAVSLAQNLSRLTELRFSLRTQMADSPLCDGKRFASDLLALLRQVWDERNA
jgi:predicted O-linked N-acetylglucosamine transferase (SPINDLY family)